MSDTFPMIEVANPGIGPGQPPTILVHRTWTLEDVNKALEGVPDHKIDPEGFITAMDNLRKSYHLDGQEAQQAWMTALKTDWHLVRGDWTPLENDTVLGHGNAELTARLTALSNRFRQKFT